MADARLGRGRTGPIEHAPIDRRAVLVDQHLADIGAGERLAGHGVVAVHQRPTAVDPQVGVDPHREIEDRRAARQEDRFTIRGEDEHLGRAPLVGIQPALARIPPLWPSRWRDPPGQVDQIPLAIVAIHRRGHDPDLDLYDPLGTRWRRILDRGMDRLIAVLFGPTDIIAQLCAGHRIGVVDRTQRAIAVLNIVDQDDHHIGPRRRPAQAIEAFVDQPIERARAALDARRDPLRAQQRTKLVLQRSKKLRPHRLRAALQIAHVRNQAWIEQTSLGVEQFDTYVPHPEPSADRRRGADRRCADVGAGILAVAQPHEQFGDLEDAGRRVEIGQHKEFPDRLDILQRRARDAAAERGQGAGSGHSHGADKRCELIGPEHATLDSAHQQADLGQIARQAPGAQLRADLA